MLGTLLMLLEARKDSKKSGQFIKKSRNVDTYLTANPDTTSHL